MIELTPEDLNDIILILIAPYFTILMFFISNKLGMGFLSTGIAFIEIEDFSKFSGISENRIRSVYGGKEKTKFLILDENEKETISEVIFDSNSMKVIETQNFEVDFKKLLELRKNKFAHVLRVKSENITISDDGNTFCQISKEDGKEEEIGSVTFDNDNNVIEVKGKFKKYF